MDDEPNRVDQEASPEKIKQLDVTLLKVIATLTPIQINESVDGWQVKLYDATIPHQDGLVHFSASILFHEIFGPVQKIYVGITRTTCELVGQYPRKEFSFDLIDTAVQRGESLTIDDDGTVIAGSQETFSFTDEVAVDARQDQLVADPSFEGTTNGLRLPRFETTPTGEVYEDGVEVAAEHASLLPEVAISSTIIFGSEEEAAHHERKMAAWRQAVKDIGTLFTEKRADRLVQVLTELEESHTTQER